MTVWYEIPDFPGYRINQHAEVLSLKQSQPRLMKFSINSKGYYQTAFRRDGKYVNVKLHVLMARTFLGPCPEGMEVCHNTPDRLNCLLTNLRYDTSSANNYDQVIHGTHHEASRTHCDQGHEFTPENTGWRWDKNGKAGGRKCRRCKKCSAIALKKQRAKNKAAQTADTH